MKYQLSAEWENQLIVEICREFLIIICFVGIYSNIL